MFALVFGIILLANDDWIPGGIIVVAALVVLGVQIPIVWRLRKERVAPSTPGSQQ